MYSPLIWVFAVVLTVLGATVGSVKRVNEGNQALVERLGRYHRTLTAGLNFWVLPIVDELVIEASMREQILDIDPSNVITKDNVTIKIDAVIFWQILELRQAYYKITDIEEALKNLVVTTLRSQIGSMDLQEIYSSRASINRSLSESLDEATDPWGVKVTRVEVQDIQLPESIKTALERERASQSEQRAMEAEAAGRKKAAIENATAIAESVQRISEAVQGTPRGEEILRYLVAQRYVDANLQLGQSANAKVVFMNPRDLSEGVSELISTPEQRSNNGDSGKGA
ncbi:stomatin-like protein [Leptolyngbya sp. FACHB-711]|jgi:regulator of protease activity HflC (stomatin/prohibitin superfamily)|uniref:SPFH domain-containing protein n=1 Tax=unclassified Leptolyngbya TaxID=2650499 RepID=UPI0016879C2A|nr:stomatin-like protein [Leptolyngbya sp. FACHB-711]MBD1850516.1 paraslipin [Cyanobacteria bacterium FACHB-502]MBD2027321.1 paraslipin [Leptolyngbya sp. FACHB-711]